MSVQSNKEIIQVIRVIAEIIGFQSSMFGISVKVRCIVEIVEIHVYMYNMFYSLTKQNVEYLFYNKLKLLGEVSNSNFSTHKNNNKGSRFYIP